jgi:transcriptional regulator, tetR family
MYEKFLELPEEKQDKIRNAGMEFFGKYGYKKTNTQDIADKAGISKGLLFYYFKNKESFYRYLCEFCETIMRKSICYEEFSNIHDFFELFDYGVKVKLELISQYPHIYEFSLTMFLSSQKEDTASSSFVNEMMDTSFEVYFKHMDASLFKEEIDPKQIYRMMLWMSEGYILEKQRTGSSLSFEEMVEDFNVWKEMFKKVSYREEYL